ncbi:hypothetical protein ACUNXA_004495, partial [Salmonella enterica subsp. enterica serovar Bareilly]
HTLGRVRVLLVRCVPTGVGSTAAVICNAVRNADNRDRPFNRWGDSLAFSCWGRKSRQKHAAIVIYVIYLSICLMIK